MYNHWFVLVNVIALSFFSRTSSSPAPVAAAPSFIGGGSQISLLGSLGAKPASSSSAGSDPCYDEDGGSKRCQPDFVNAAFGRQVVASSTCGSPSVTRYCLTSRDRDGRIGRSCYVCDATQPRRRHPASYLTDLNNPSNLTCWISQPIREQPTTVMNGGGNTSGNVTLTLSLGKKFEVRAVTSETIISNYNILNGQDYLFESAMGVHPLHAWNICINSFHSLGYWYRNSYET